MTLRVYADFNSTTGDSSGEWCWCLRYQNQPLDEFTQSLGLYEGMPVILYYDDPNEEFEMDARLGRPDGKRWMALFDRSTFRLLRDVNAR